jgi:NTP pyrophosphatase (non-canonical NTP hydrolase)
MKTKFVWLIEAPGPRYLAARKLGAHHFHWSDDPHKAVQFTSATQADIVMATVRTMDPNLFAFAGLLGEAKPVEHGFGIDDHAIPGEVRRLTFAEVAEIGRARSNRWHKGGIEEWTLSDWFVAMAGEAGEACNAVKKLRRVELDMAQVTGPKTIEAAKAEIAKELGDTFLYLDLCAQRLGLRLEDCIRDTFNRVSEREGFPERL